LPCQRAREAAWHRAYFEKHGKWYRPPSRRGEAYYRERKIEYCRRQRAGECTVCMKKVLKGRTKCKYHVEKSRLDAQACRARQ
jgi:hypothetical protein